MRQNNKLLKVYVPPVLELYTKMMGKLKVYPVESGGRNVKIIPFRATGVFDNVEGQITLDKDGLAIDLTRDNLFTIVNIRVEIENKSISDVVSYVKRETVTQLVMALRRIECWFANNRYDGHASVEILTKCQTMLNNIRGA